jgi:hypothetical protein
MISALELPAPISKRSGAIPAMVFQHLPTWLAESRRSGSVSGPSLSPARRGGLMAPPKWRMPGNSSAENNN